MKSSRTAGPREPVERERVSVMKEEGYWVTANLESYRRGTP